MPELALITAAPGVADIGAVLTAISLVIVLLVLLGVALVIAVLLFIVRVVRTLLALRRTSAPGRRVSAAESGTHPLTNFNRAGIVSDPLNITVVATGAQLAAAFAAAGWYRADELVLITSIRISLDALLNRKYSSAPVSTLYLYGRGQDYAFERPGSSVRERDHIRFWDTAQRGKDGRPIWIGGATKDIAVEFSPATHFPTHRIAPDVDAERAQVVHDLTATGWVIAQSWEPGFGHPVEMKNATNDPWHTDGQIAALTLASVPVLAPISQNIRGPVGGSVARAVARLLRWRLPQAGRARARALRQGDRAKAGVNATKSDSK
ncbi:MAG: LssY C-terminal domain-containing protein [Ktedonobacterales bacterium]